MSTEHMTDTAIILATVWLAILFVALTDYGMNNE